MAKNITFLVFIRRIVHQIWIVIQFAFSSNESMLKLLMNRWFSYKYTPRRSTFGPIQSVYIDKPEDIQIVLNSPAALGKSHLYRVMKATMGNGLLTAPVPKWRKHRRLISPIFNVRLLENFLPVFNQKNRMLIKELKEECQAGQQIDLWNYLAPMALDIVCETVMNFDDETGMGQNEKNKFQESIIRLAALASARFYKLWFHSDFITTVYSFISGHSKDIDFVNQFVRKAIQRKKRAFLEVEEAARPIHQNGKEYSKINENGSLIMTTFLDRLIELNYQGVEFTDQDLQDEVMTMMIAGSETSAVTNCFSLLMLAMHPHIQKQVYDEIITVLGNEDRYIDKQDIQNMVYLEQCIKETMRLFPIAPIIQRMAEEDIKLRNDFVIYKNTTIIIPTIMVHRDPKTYKNPEMWNPDNFSLQRCEKRNKYSFLGFSEGPRGCIGSKYAMMSMKLTHALILKNFYLSTDLKLKDIRLKLDLLLKSVTGYQMKLHPR